MALIPVGIALGSNLGDREAELDAGISFLRYISATNEVRKSPLIETAPVDCPPGSAPFLNAVVEIELDSVEMPPLRLLAVLQEFEFRRGRSPLRGINDPRSLDLDIIYYGVERIDQLGLIVPHPRAHLRRFVLEPLSFVRPDLVLPGQQKTVKELLAALKKVNSTRQP
jgi:2-amino-4-hydroxy-6-hydroxymethyldihydropteridine diphosphokinase